MSDNKRARMKLERIYGKICMIEAAGIRCIPISERRKIKGYKKYDDMITFHHIREKCKGGDATPDNGALVKGYNHQWLHSLPEEEKQAVNKKLIEFKISALAFTEKGIQPTSQPVTLTLDVDSSDCITIPVYDVTKEDLAKRKKFNRARVKRETEQFIEEELEDYLYEEDER